MFNEESTATIERPFTRSPEQLRDLVGSLEEREREMLDEYIKTKDKEADLIQPLQEAVHRIDPSVNENIDPLMEDIALMRQESHAQKEWSAWEYISSIPGKMWNGIKAHPKITAAVVMTGMIAAAYYTGAFSLVIERIKAWAISHGVGQFFGQASEMAAGGIVAAKESAAVVADKAAAGLEVAKDAAAGAVESAEATLGTAGDLATEGVEAAQAAGQTASEAAQGAVDTVTGAADSAMESLGIGGDGVAGAADTAVEGAAEAATGFTPEEIEAATEAYNGGAEFVPPVETIPGDVPVPTPVPGGVPDIPPPGVLPPEGVPAPEVMPDVPSGTIPDQVPSVEEALELLDEEK